MSAQLTEAEGLKRKFSSLIGELGEAKIHFSLYKRLSAALKGKEFLEAWGFWNYTITAHAHSTLLHLCRVYDDFRGRKRRRKCALFCLWLLDCVKKILGIKLERKKENNDPFHLSRFVEEVKMMHGVELKDKKEKRQHANDLEFVRRDPRVVKLRKWRNNVICHRNQDLLQGGKEKEEFFTKYGFDREGKEIEELIEKGFAILEHWEPYYESDYSLWISKIAPSILQEVEGVLPVLESLRLRLNQQRQVQ